MTTAIYYGFTAALGVITFLLALWAMLYACGTIIEWWSER